MIGVQVTFGGTPVRTIGKYVIQDRPYGLAASADVIAVGVWESTVHLFDAASGDCIRSFGGPGEGPGCLHGCVALRFSKCVLCLCV